TGDAAIGRVAFQAAQITDVEHVFELGMAFWKGAQGAVTIGPWLADPAMVSGAVDPTAGFPFGDFHYRDGREVHLGSDIESDPQFHSAPSRPHGSSSGWIIRSMDSASKT